MRKLTAIAVALSSVVIMPDALALGGKTFVSSSGTDANVSNSCSKGSPCRTFQAAYDITVPNGQIVALDSGQYGGLTISSAITITAAPGVTAIVQVSANATGFTVSAGADDLVVLRNLMFFGTNANTTGIAHSGGKLVVDHVTFSTLTTGMTSTAKSDLLYPEFLGNTTGLVVNGAGTSDGLTCVTACARVRGGDFIGNGTALSQLNPGASSNNILLWIAGNSTADLQTVFTANGTLGGYGYYGSGTNVH